ncbi:uncharacterized protein [Nicotiana sylvestris]|uniref:uncharacterized protein n=1 Tax=Nicotiana sylvestris TaxID=4096 RepID=UPI00388CA7B5
MEFQLGQISQPLNTRPKGALPSDTIVNPQGGNNTGHAMLMITRSGRGGDVNTSKQKEIVSDEIQVQDDDVPLVDEQVREENVNEEVRIDVHDDEVETQDNVKPSREHSLSINVPLVEALEQVPGYAKFIKDLVTKKRSMNCESINLMPYSMFKTLGIEQPRATSMRLQMADRTMKRPLGIVDDVLVQVDMFILTTDFVILDCEVDYEVPIILGRPFLATRKSLVDVKAGKLTFRLNSTEVCSFVDLVTAVIVDDTNSMINMEDPLEAVLLNLDVNEDEGRVECVNALHGMGSYSYEPRKLSLDIENRKTPPTKPLIEEPPVLDLNPLPPHLRYEFLGPSSTSPVILSSCLTNMQVDATLAVIQKQKKAVGWTLADIQGISLAFCMHKIILEEDAKPSVEHQRRLNEAMQEVVKKEVIKWLDAGVMYPFQIVLGLRRCNVCRRRVV